MSNDPKLKPCPHCGSTDLQVCWNSVYEDHYVRCYNCRMQGPEIYGREAASEAWNNLPRKLEWSDEIKEVGYYFETKGGKGIPGFVYICGFTHGKKSQDGTRWAGPIIPPPKEGE